MAFQNNLIRSFMVLGKLLYVLSKEQFRGIGFEIQFFVS